MVGACQQNSGIFLVRGGGAGAGSGRDTGWGRGWAGRDSDDQITGAGSGLGEMPAEAGAGQGEIPTTKSPGQAAGKSPGQAAGSERDACGCRGWAGNGLGATYLRGPRLGRQRNLQGPGRRQPNQLKRKRSIISSSNSGFSKSFSLVMIRLLCSQNPASW